MLKNETAVFFSEYIFMHFVKEENIIKYILQNFKW